MVSYSEVVKLVDQLTPQEQRALFAYLQERAHYRQLTAQERTALFDSLIVDLGPVSPDFSDRREDWYGDDER